MIHARTLQALEFHRIKEHLAALCISSAGHAQALALLPLMDVAAVENAAHLYEEFCYWSECSAEGNSAFNLTAFPDISALFAAAKSKAGQRLSPDIDAFWALREVLCLAKEAHASIAVPDGVKRWPHLLQLSESTPVPAQLTAALLRCISDDGLLRDESSPELYRLRAELRQLHQRCLHKVKDFAQQYNIVAYLQDEFITLSSDRYVLPLKASYKGRMQGIIHDWSQTGETCYFEPLFLVEINNRLQELKREEREEERNILTYLRDLLYAELPGACAALDLLTQLDVLQAARRLAYFFDGRILPLTPDNEGISLLHARHPLLVLSHMGTTKATPVHDSVLAQAQAMVRPIDIILRPGERALIITGGNAGGKTVCLKTLGIITAMALCGLPVPVAPGSHLPWFGRMDAFIGDEQSLVDNVSTFTAQIEHLGKAWKHLDANSLVLLDEFGAGTDPAQGAALAQAVLDELLNKHTFVLAATHFPSLKNYALSSDGARAASMLFDPDNHKPLFKLAYDQIGASLALDVAREHGLPESVLRRAEHYLLQNGEDAAPIIARLNALAARREEELTVLAREQHKAQQQARVLREKLEKERSLLCDEIRSHAAELMRAWKEDKLSHKQALKELSRLRTSLLPDHTGKTPSILPEVATVVPGQEVFHTVFNKRGIITDVDKRRDRIRLDMNGVRLWADIKDIRMPGGKNAAQRPGSGSVLGSVKNGSAALTVDLRGQRVDSALAELERFLDNALLAGFSEVEIVHGRGTGALRRQVHEFLRSFSAVDSYKSAPEDRGGDGMTIVHLR